MAKLHHNSRMLANPAGCAGIVAWQPHRGHGVAHRQRWPEEAKIASASMYPVYSSTIHRVHLAKRSHLKC